MVELLEKEILNARALKRLQKEINKHAETAHIPTESQQQEELREIGMALKNVAEAIEKGLLTDVLVARLHELEKRKNELCAHPSHKAAGKAPIAIDPQMILDEYREIKSSPSFPTYKDYIRSFIDRIEVGKYSVWITLKTGLDIFPDLDTTLEIRRQEIYPKKKTV